MKLSHIIQPLTEDLKAICAAHGMEPSELAMPAGKTGLANMYAALDIVSKNRAYDDTHPGFSSGTWKRVLPYDGRDFCFYYADGANDTHVATLLRAVQKELSK